jgi:two-component system, OmpR family, response regulator RpaA
VAAKDLSSKKFFTTGQIAKICGVSIATVQKWIDAGEIESYRLPLTASERRVPRVSLLSFMKKYGVPTDELEAGQRFRVLIVDGDAAVRKQVESVWSGEEPSPEIISLDDGAQALLEIGAFKPNVIVMDIHTPGLEGIRAAEMLRKHETLKASEIVVVSEVSNDEQAQLEKLGVSTIIAKPIKGQKLKNALLKASGKA